MMKVDGVEMIVSPAVSCVCIITVVYFVMVAIVEVLRFLSEAAKAATGNTSQLDSGYADVDAFTKFREIFNTAIESMHLAPMLCILFLACRLRAIEVGRDNPQKWAQTCFWVSTITVVGLTCLTAMTPICFGARLKRGASETDLVFEVTNRSAVMGLTIARYVLMVVLYGCFCAIVTSIFMLDEDANQKMPTSTACIIHLVDMYYFVYVGAWLCMTIRQFSQPTDTSFQGPRTLDIIAQTFEVARSTVTFIPVTAVLIFAARLRASQVTMAQGAPQEWVQSAMVSSTGAIFVQLIVVLLSPCCAVAAPQINVDGTIDEIKTPNKNANTCITWMRAILVLVLYGGLISVVVGIYLMNPQVCMNAPRTIV
jgi:hypothetical protein